jgi:hypothetical protein
MKSFCGGVQGGQYFSKSAPLAAGGTLKLLMMLAKSSFFKKYIENNRLTW